MQVRNGFLERSRTKAPALGAVAQVPSPILVEGYGDVGLDYEHAGAASPQNTGEPGKLVRTVFGVWVDAFGGNGA